jgi:hypothetical protein
MEPLGLRMRPAVVDVPAAYEEPHSGSITCRGTSLSSVRGRFVELVGRQLELFEAEWAGLLGDCQAALDEYNAAPRDEAEERYGDYLDLLDAARDALLEYRDGFARTLDEEGAEEYEAVFNQAVRKRLPSLGLELD